MLRRDVLMRCNGRRTYLLSKAQIFQRGAASDADLGLHQIHPCDLLCACVLHLASAGTIIIQHPSKYSTPIATASFVQPFSIARRAPAADRLCHLSSVMMLYYMPLAQPAEHSCFDFHTTKLQCASGSLVPGR